MGDTRVKLSEGVHQTLAVFGLLHDAFQSASVGGTSTLPLPKTRFLEEFVAKYERMLESAKGLYTESNLKTALSDLHLKHGGDRLVPFAKVWKEFITVEYPKAPRPTGDDQKSTLDALGKIEILVTQLQKTKALEQIRLLEQNQNVRTTYPTICTDPNLLRGIVLARSEAFGSNGIRVPSYHLEVAEASQFVAAAIAHVIETPLSPINLKKGTWLDFVNNAAELDNDKYKDAAFLGLAANAKALLEKPMDRLYSEDLGIVDALVASLEKAADHAMTSAVPLQRNQAPSADAELGKKLITYANDIRAFIVKLRAYRSTEKTEMFDKAFGLTMGPLKQSKEFGSADITKWTRPTKGAYIPSASPTSSSLTSGTGKGAMGSGQGSGPLFRHIDEARTKECSALANKFLQSLNGEVDSGPANRIVKNANQSLGEIKSQITKLSRVEHADGNVYAINGLSEQHVRIVRTCMSRVRGMLTRHTARHVMFALRHNRGALRYMIYWRDSKIPASAQYTAEYFEKLAAVTDKGKVELDLIMRDITSAMQLAETFDGLSDMEVEALSERFDALRMYHGDCKERISKVHSKPSTFIDQLLSDTHVHLIYALKVIRFALAWVSMRIAVSAFSRIYASNVYIKNVDPPSPLLFLAIFFAIDISVNMALLTLLWAASRIFKSPSNEFPIDSYLLTAWMVDIVCSELAMMGIGFAFANIISTKKAFRYRQEGDRGMRALGQMMLYSYAVLLWIPFFRIV